MGGECRKVYTCTAHPRPWTPKFPPLAPGGSTSGLCYLLPEFHDEGCGSVLGRARCAGCGVVQEVHAVLCGGRGHAMGPAGRDVPSHPVPTLWPALSFPSPRSPLSASGVPPREAQGNQPLSQPPPRVLVHAQNLLTASSGPLVPLPLWSPGSGAR